MTLSSKLFMAGLLASTVLTAPSLAHAQAASNQTDVPAPTQAEDDVTQIDEIIVRGRFVPDVKRETSEVSNILTAEDIARTGDSEISEALTRVTGLSLVGDGFVYVRGLGERYSSALLNGSTLPSPEPLRRVVPLDLFPTSLINSAVIQKTYSVEFPGEFSGGLISLRTRAIPDENYFDFGISTGGNTESTFQEGLYWDAGDDLSNIGIGESLGVPTLVADDPSLDSYQNDPDLLQAVGRSFRNRWSITGQDNLPDFGMNLTGARSFDLANGVRAGALIALDYDWQARNRVGERATFDANGNLRDNFSRELCQTNYTAIDPETCGTRRTELEISLNALASFGLQFTPDHELTFTSLLLRKTRNQALIERGEQDVDPGLLRSFQRLNWVEQEVISNQLAGSHQFYFDGPFTEFSVDWRGSYATADRDTPYRREYTYLLEGDTFRLSSRLDGNQTIFTGLHDENIEAGVDLGLTGDFGGREIIFKGGVLRQERDREFASRRYSFDYTGVDAALDLRTFVPEIIFSPDNIGLGGYLPVDLSTPSDFFDATMETNAGYVAMEAQLTPDFRVNGGVRFEESEQTVNTAITGGPNDGDPLRVTLRGEHTLPAITATWEFADNMQFRAGYSSTISRPDLRELANAEFLDEDTGVLEVGNPNLTIAEIQNFDARVEWYFGNRQSATFGVFYKQFDDPIVRVFVAPSGEDARRSFINADEATLFGAEAEVDYTLPLDQWFANPMFLDNRFFVIANVTYIDGEQVLDPLAAGRTTNLVSALQGQSEWLGNLQLGFENDVSRRRATLLLNYTGERISDTGISGAPDIIENPPVLLDFAAAQGFDAWGREMEVSFRVENILGEEFERTQGGAVFESYELGTTVSVGLKARF